MNGPRSEKTDSALVQQVALGADAAFDELYRAYKGDVLRVIRRACYLDEGECNDIAQEVFFTAWVEITAGRFDVGGCFKHWLLRVAHNKAINARLRAGVRRRRFPEISQRRAGYEANVADVAGHEPPPDYCLLERERSQSRDDQLARLDQGLAELPPLDSEIIRLYHMQDLTYAEISGAIGLSISQVWKRHKQAVAQLREFFGQALLTRPA